MIRHRGLQKAMVASALDLSSTTLSNYLRGRRSVPHDLRAKFADLLRCPVDDLFPLPQAPSVYQTASSAHEIDQQPIEIPNSPSSIRDFSAYLEADTLHMKSFQQISALLSAPSVSPQELDAQVLDLWIQRSTIGIPIEVHYTHVLQLLDILKPLLQHAWLPSERLHLCDIVSRTILLAGVLLHDRGLHSHARQAMQTALQAAEEAANPVLKAIIWTWMSFTWTYTSSISLALPCILEANALMTQTSERRMQAWIQAVQAEIYALLGRRKECLHCLSQAGYSADYPMSDRYSFVVFDETLLDGYRGVCLQQFYRQEDASTYAYLREAKEALNRALGSAQSTRRMLYYLGDLATAEARQGEVEAACQYAIQNIVQLHHVASKSIWRRVVEVRSLLEPYQDVSSVKMLQAHIEHVQDLKQCPL